MTTYNTGNALGSSDARDLYDNAENIDRFANGSANTYQDRLGITRKSLAGMNNAFDDFIESSGYTVPVAYTSGIVLSAYNQLVEYNDEFYKLKAGQAPYTTTGTWGTDSAKLVAVGDAALRQELAAEDGADQVGYGAETVQDALDARLPEIANYAALRAYAGPVTAYYVRGVANAFDGGAGVFRVDADDTTTADNGGTVLVDASGRRWKREFSGAVNVLWFGADRSGVIDSTASVMAAINSAHNKIYIPHGNYLVASAGNMTFTGLNDKYIYGEGRLVKGGGNGVFWFVSCTNIVVDGLTFDGQIATDEATYGDIRPNNNRPSNRYAFAIFFWKCDKCKALNNKVNDFSWDGIVVQGDIPSGGLTCTYSDEIEIRGNRLSNVRGSMIWLEGVQNFSVENNGGFNDSGFDQKANFIFLVDWCNFGKVTGNASYHIGDNALGIGQQRWPVEAAVNKNILVSGNRFDFGRYHAILVAAGRNIQITNNTITRAGAKTVMAGTSISITTAAIYLLGGTDGVTTEPVNKDVVIESNYIENAYEIGIWIVDRQATPIADASSGIVIRNNIIKDTGKLVQASRLNSGSIRTQCQRPVTIQANQIYNGNGRGIYVLGDAIVTDNVIDGISNYSNDGYGIQLSDSASINQMVNRRLAGAVTRNAVKNTTRTGIFVFDKDRAVVEDNTVEACGIDTLPGTQNGSIASEYAGIGINRVKAAVVSANDAKGCGSSGIVVYNLVLSTSSAVESVVSGIGNICESNGVVFTTAQYRAGVYLEGSTTNAVKGTLQSSVFLAGATQQFPMRVSNGAGFISLDERSDAHPNASLGPTQKLTANI